MCWQYVADVVANLCPGALVLTPLLMALTMLTTCLESCVHETLAPANVSRRYPDANALMHCEMHVVLLPNVHSQSLAHKHSFLHKDLNEQ
jgi:hypothetical protein